jgi:hypothetical protein
VLQGSPKQGILKLYRSVQKEVPWLLSIYGIDADPVEVRGKIRQVFKRNGTTELEPRVANMLVSDPRLAPRFEHYAALPFPIFAPACSARPLPAQLTTLRGAVARQIVKGQMELDEALAQWKTRTHIMRFVQEVVSPSPPSLLPPQLAPKQALVAPALSRL